MLLFRSMRASLPHIQATRGSAFVAINEWLSYFNVRMKQVEIRAGTEVMMKVEPVRHVVSDGFRELDQEERGCLLQDEQVLISCLHLLSHWKNRTDLISVDFTGI